jgi:hypothetical protein
LAVGAGATTALSAVQGGLPTLGPAIQETFELSLVEVTAVFTTFGLGTVDAGDPGRRGLRPDWRRWLSRVLALPRRRTG